MSLRKQVFDKKVVEKYLKKGKEIETKNNIEEMKSYYKQSVSDLPIEYCYGCSYDNVGNCYCTDKDKFRVCYHNWILNLEKFL